MDVTEENMRWVYLVYPQVLHNMYSTVMKVSSVARIITPENVSSYYMTAGRERTPTISKKGKGGVGVI